RTVRGPTRLRTEQPTTRDLVPGGQAEPGREVFGGWPLPHVVAAFSDQPQDGVRPEAMDLGEIRPEQGVQPGPCVELGLVLGLGLRKQPAGPAAGCSADGTTASNAASGISPAATCGSTSRSRSGAWPVSAVAR